MMRKFPLAGMLTLVLGFYVSPSLAQPLFEDVATATTSGDGTMSGLTIPVPASTSGNAAGDLLVAVHGVNINPTTLTPAGWTAVTGHSGFNQAICSSQNPEGIRCQLSVFWKFSDGTETSVFFSLMNPGSPRQVAGAVLRYSNTHTVSPIGPVMSQNGTGQTLTAPAVSTTEADSRVLRVGLVDANGPDNASALLTGGLATARFNLRTRTPLDFSSVLMAGSDAAQPLAGSTGTATWTGGDGNWRASTIVIRPMQTIVSADLSITKTDGETKVNPGATLVYTITAMNSNGSTDGVDNATVSDMFPSALTCSWTCVGSGGGSCTAFGNGDISDSNVDLPVGASATYTATCNLDPIANGSVMNTATIDLTGDVELDDSDEGNNFASDTTQINQPPMAVCADTSVNADDMCQADVSIDGGSFDPDGDVPLSLSQAPPGPYSLGDTLVTLTAMDTLGLSNSCQATVSVVDVTPPLLSCNNPPTITPPNKPMSFTATAEDNCGVGAPLITTYSCFEVKKNGNIVDKSSSCKVALSGDTITIKHSGGVGTTIQWTVVASDGSGNMSALDCSIQTVIPGQN